MLRKLLLIFLLACSACTHPGPKVTVCLVRGVVLTDPGTGQALPLGCDCYDERTGKAFFLALDQCDKYVAMPSADAAAIANYCGIKGN